jgi:geranylgeranyl pyrophosphate synthase
VEGEWLQLELLDQVTVSRGCLEKIAVKKTARLFEWTAMCPTFVSDLGHDVESLKLFGRQVGLAFQMIDDVLDYQRQTGKPYLQDLRERRLNFVSQDLVSRFPELESNWTWDPQKPAWTEVQLNTSLAEIRLQVRVICQSLRILISQLSTGDQSGSRGLEDLIDLLEERAR